MTDRLLDLKAAPAETRKRLADFRSSLQQAAGENLISLVVYGGLARGHYKPGSSDINVAIVLDNTDPASLRAIGPALAAGARSIGVVPYLLRDEELADASESFPLTLLEIRDGGVTIGGREVFKNLEVDRALIALRCEQELRNRLMRLRRRVALAGDDSLELFTVLRRNVVGVATDWRWLLMLKDKTTPEADDPRDLIRAATREFGLDPRLERLANLRLGEPHATMNGAELRELANGLLAALETTTRMARTGRTG